MGVSSIILVVGLLKQYRIVLIVFNVFLFHFHVMHTKQAIVMESTMIHCIPVFFFLVFFFLVVFFFGACT